MLCKQLPRCSAALRASALVPKSRQSLVAVGCCFATVVKLPQDAEVRMHPPCCLALALRCATGAEDWVVDTLALHDHMHLLRDVLADPGVVKVWAECWW